MSDASCDTGYAETVNDEQNDRMLDSTRLSFLIFCSLHLYTSEAGSEPMKTATLASAILIVLIIAGASVASYYYGASTAQGGGGTTTSVSTFTKTVAINQTLVDLAKAEGNTVTVYGVWDSSDEPIMQNVMQQSFPWLSVNYVQLSPSDLNTRILTEYQTGNVQADVAVNALSTFELLVTQHAIQPYQNPMEAFMNYTNAASTDSDHYWTPLFQAPLVLAYNTNLVTDTSTLPKSWSDLTNPTWNGKITMDNPDTLSTSATVFGSLLPSMGNTSLTAMLQGIAANHPIIASSASASFSNLATGQAELGIAPLNDLITSPANTPVKPIWFSTAYSIYVVGGVAAKAPHPYLAELYLQWFSSYSGQAAISMTGRVPMSGIVASHYFSQWMPSNVAYIAGGSGTTMSTNPDAWVRYFTRIFG